MSFIKKNEIHFVQVKGRIFVLHLDAVIILVS